MKYLFGLFSLLIFTHFGLAQERTYVRDEGSLMEKRGGIGTLVIIPFEDDMYMSDADAPIGRETGLSPGQLMTKFRFSIVETLEREMQKDWDIRVLNEDSQLEEGFGMDYIHSSVQYRYVPIPDEVLMANDTTIEKKELKKKKNKNERKNGIYEGQVVTTSDSREKYMTLVVNNDTLIKFMDSSLFSDYYLFLNEFDIRHHVTDPDKITSGGLKYRMKVHFTCIDKFGTPLISGAATSDVSADTKNIYSIIQEGIPELTAKLAKMIRKKRLDTMDQ